MGKDESLTNHAEHRNVLQKSRDRDTLGVHISKNDTYEFDFQKITQNMNIEYFLIIRVTTASSIPATSAPHAHLLHNPRISLFDH